MTPFAELRAACATLCRDARFVRIDPARARGLAEAARSDGVATTWDRATHFAGDVEATLAYVLTLDTLNFGSGWFPALRKRPGRSGYFALSMGLKEAFESEGPFPPRRLSVFEPAAVARLYGQPAEALTSELAEFLELSARALRDLGTLLELEYDGSFAALRRAAGRSAADLVARLARMPLFRDVAHTATGLALPFYKRAQIAASDLATAFPDHDFGRFRDLDQLTAFADNTLPHVLRCEGVLHYDSALAGKIERGEEIPNGSPEEIEIRASAVHCVETMCRHLSSDGDSIAPRELDAWLWTRGQGGAYKARPRHRTRCAFY